MTKIFLVLLLLPVLIFGQAKSKAKLKPKKKAVTIVEQKPVDGFIINGDVTGFADGTTVSLLNGQSGAEETSTTIQKNKFVLKGKMAEPDFKILLFNKQPPYATLFLDNSLVHVTGTKEAIDKVIVTGSPSHKDYDAFTKAVEPYQNAFSEDAPYDSATIANATWVTEDFARRHPTSHVAALAVIRFNQVADNDHKTEELYNVLSPEVRSSGMGNYLAQLIADAKKNAIGTVLPDFTQNDTSGKPLSLSSLRGKFVLIDFWASWCRPCRQENPNVVAAYNKFKDKNFTVLGVSLDKAKPAWVDAIQMDGLTWSHVSDLQGWNNAVAQKFQIFSIPQNFLIDPDGKLVGKNLRGVRLEKKLDMLLR